MAVARRSLILVGLPGSGKTTAGAAAAALLQAPFADADRGIEARAGTTIQRIFADRGEAAFRELERAMMAELLNGPPAVLAPGGGWFLDPAERARGLSLGYVVYMETPPAVAARRLGGAAGRPLLAGYDPALRLRQLLEQREAAYLEAPGRVATAQLGVHEVAARLAELARTEAGW